MLALEDTQKWKIDDTKGGDQITTQHNTMIILGQLMDVAYGNLAATTPAS